MSLFKLAMLSITPLVLSYSSAIAWADLPADRYITYNIRSNPTNENSDIVFRVSLKLHAESSLGSSVGWRIQEIRFLKPGQGGGSSTLWIKSSPTVSSSDGRWWVTHVTLLSPLVSEFVRPPALSGTATAQTANTANLNFNFDSVAYVGSLMFGGNVAALDYRFTRVGQSEPEEEGDDEPTETGEGENPPA